MMSVEEIVKAINELQTVEDLQKVAEAVKARVQGVADALDRGASKQ